MSQRWTPEDVQRYRSRQSIVTAARTPLKLRSGAPTKYRNVPTVVNGIRFASGLEAAYYKQLHLRWVAGEVLWFLMQVPIRIEGGKYVVDFLYCTPGPPYTHFADTTGFVTPMKLKKLKQVKERWNISVELVRKV